MRAGRKRPGKALDAFGGMGSKFGASGAAKSMLTGAQAASAQSAAAARTRRKGKTGMSAEPGSEQSEESDRLTEFTFREAVFPAPFVFLACGQGLLFPLRIRIGVFLELDV